MRKKTLTRNERKQSIVVWFAIRLQHDNNEWASMYAIAKGLGLSPSSYLTSILEEMVTDDQLTSMPLIKDGRWEGRCYMLPNNANILVANRRLITVNSSKGQMRLEL